MDHYLGHLDQLIHFGVWVRILKIWASSAILDSTLRVFFTILPLSRSHGVLSCKM